MAFGVSAAEIRTIVEEEVADILAQTNKLAGVTPGKSSVKGNWQAGATDLVNIGDAGERKKLNSLQVDISQLTTGARITIRLYELVNGTERQVYPSPGTTWVVGTDPDAIWVVDGPVEITGVLRVEVQSDNVNDNGKYIAYEYALEDM
ncbi:hypothetical protein ES707_04888 [subsurface metagenome]